MNIVAPQTARIVQVSSTETITYDMPWEVYSVMKDVMEDWRYHHSRSDKCTVEKVLALFDQVGMPVRDQVTVKREPTKPAIRGLSAGVWLDPDGYSKEEDGV